jgi:AcrR family transcriptional regulator
MNLEVVALDGRMKFIEAAMRLLEADGPAEIKARAVAREAGSTTMGLYTHFKGIPELLRALVDEGFSRQAKIFGLAPKGADPMANLYALALACRHFAGNAPHLYDLMYGLSIHGRYNNARGGEQAAEAEPSPAFADVFAYLLAECENLRMTQPIIISDAVHVAYQFWSALHGFVMLDLAGHFSETADPAVEVLLPVCVNLVVGMGASRAEAERSAEAATISWKSVSQS